MKYGMTSLSGINVIHFMILVLFYMLFGTSLIVLIKNIEISLTIIMIYTVLEVLTLGEFIHGRTSFYSIRLFGIHFY